MYCCHRIHVYIRTYIYIRPRDADGRQSSRPDLHLYCNSGWSESNLVVLEGVLPCFRMGFGYIEAGLVYSIIDAFQAGSCYSMQQVWYSGADLN